MSPSPHHEGQAHRPPRSPQGISPHPERASRHPCSGSPLQQTWIHWILPFNPQSCSCVSAQNEEQQPLPWAAHFGVPSAGQCPPRLLPPCCGGTWCQFPSLTNVVLASVTADLQGEKGVSRAAGGRGLLVSPTSLARCFVSFWGSFSSNQTLTSQLQDRPAAPSASPVTALERPGSFQTRAEASQPRLRVSHLNAV